MTDHKNDSGKIDDTDALLLLAALFSFGLGTGSVIREIVSHRNIAEDLADPEKRDDLINEITSEENVRKFLKAAETVDEHDLVEGTKQLEERLRAEIERIKEIDAINAKYVNPEKGRARGE